MARMPEIEANTSHRFFVISRKCYGVVGRINIGGRVDCFFCILYLFNCIYRIHVGR